MSASPAYASAELPGEVRLLGDCALVFVFGDTMDDVLNARVLAAWRALRDRLPAGVTDLVPAYTTLTVFYDPGAWEPESLAALLRGRVREHGALAVDAAREFAIPVCYAGDCAPDLDAVCRHTGLSAADVIGRHSAVAYRVNFLGFTPGFPYLGGLDPRLATPRRATPRLEVPAGSVAIGGAQTGIYPQDAPGGWQIIGRTPLALFDVHRVPPCLLAPGDTVRFVPVDASAFARLAGTPA